MQLAYNVVGYLGSHLVWQVTSNQKIDLYAFLFLSRKLFCLLQIFCISPKTDGLNMFLFLSFLTTGALCCRDSEAVTRLVIKSNYHHAVLQSAMKVSSDPDLDTVWKVLTTTGSSPANFGLTVAYVSVILIFHKNHQHQDA